MPALCQYRASTANPSAALARFQAGCKFPSRKLHFLEGTVSLYHFITYSIIKSILQNWRKCTSFLKLQENLLENSLRINILRMLILKYMNISDPMNRCTHVINIVDKWLNPHLVPREFNRNSIKVTWQLVVAYELYGLLSKVNGYCRMQSRLANPQEEICQPPVIYYL